jgi:phage internal scaffolding protein
MSEQFVNIRSRFDARIAVPKVFAKPSLAKQAFKDECDVNKIMRKFEKTGLIAHMNKYQGNYADLPDAGDLQDAMNTILVAQQMFDALPAKVRKEFDNDPSAFLNFAQDPANYDEMVELGLAKPKAEAAEPAPAVAAAAPNPAPSKGGDD